MRYVFVDCGACKCEATRIFLNQGFENWDYYLFEPSPKLSKCYGSLLKDYPQINFFYSKKAVWIEDGNAEFYFSQRGHSGSTILKEKFSNKIDHNNPIKVKTIDFSSWFKETMNKNDYIILKIDIEGAEYEVLNKMIDDGTLNYVNEVIIEFHGRKKMKCTQRHHELYDKIKKYLLSRNIPMFQDNYRQIILWK